MSNCTEKQIPTHLHSNQKPTITLFDAKEYLFHRVEAINKTTGDSSILDDGSLAPSVFERPTIQGLSCNRGSFCESDKDVLFDINSKDGTHFHDTHVVGQCIHEDVNAKIFINKNDEQSFFTIFPCHDPIECMYPHTEIRIFRKDEPYNPKLNLPPTVKADIRKLYRKSFKVV